MRDKISTLGRQRLDIFFENPASDTQGKASLSLSEVLILKFSQSNP